MIWSILQTKSGKRNLVHAANGLNRQGFTTFLPWLHRRQSNRTWEKTPLFPFYLFVVAREQWRVINTTPGVLRIVLSFGRPGVIDSGIVEALQRQSAAHGGAVRLRETFPRRWQPDMDVKIIDGPFTGWTGKVMSLSDGEGRVKLLLDSVETMGVVSVRGGDLQQ